MGTLIIKRSPRRPAPEIPSGELIIDPPPEIPQAQGAKWQQALMMLPMLGGTLSMGMMYGMGGSGNKMTYVAGGLMGLSSLGMLASGIANQAGGPKKAEMIAFTKGVWDMDPIALTLSDIIRLIEGVIEFRRPQS